MLPQGDHYLVPAIALHFLVAVERPVWFDQQVRADLVEDDMPGFARAGYLIDVEDAIVHFVIEVEQAAQRLPLPGREWNALLFTGDRLPGQEAVVLQPV